MAHTQSTPDHTPVQQFSAAEWILNSTSWQKLRIAIGATAIAFSIGTIHEVGESPPHPQEHAPAIVFDDTPQPEVSQISTEE